LKVYVNNGEEEYTPLAISKKEQRHDREGYALPHRVKIGTKTWRGGLSPLAVSKMEQRHDEEAFLVVSKMERRHGEEGYPPSPFRNRNNDTTRKGRPSSSCRNWNEDTARRGIPPRRFETGTTTRRGRVGLPRCVEIGMKISPLAVSKQEQ
jgi:hypothetical protein